MPDHHWNWDAHLGEKVKMFRTKSLDLDVTETKGELEAYKGVRISPQVFHCKIMNLILPIET